MIELYNAKASKIREHLGWDENWILLKIKPIALVNAVTNKKSFQKIPSMPIIHGIFFSQKPPSCWRQHQQRRNHLPVFTDFPDFRTSIL
jgi:hypothetical protein